MSITKLDEPNPSELIATVLTTGRGSRPDVARILYNIIKDHPDNRTELFRQAAESYGFRKSSGELDLPEGGLGNIRALAKRFGRIVDGYLESTIDEDLAEDEFYERLLSFVNNPLFTNDTEREFAFYWMLVDRRLPYYKLPTGLRVSEDQFNLLKVKLDGKIKKIRFALEKEFAQSTEQADSILNLILEHDGRDERAVLFGFLISYLENRSIPQVPPL